jgi:hypothetical protein
MLNAMAKITYFVPLKMVGLLNRFVANLIEYHYFLYFWLWAAMFASCTFL